MKECHLEGRLYTWSNKREHPTLEKIDRVFITNEWEAIHPNHHLHSLASLCSDHVLLVLKTDASFAGKKCFHFRSFWVCAPDFLEVVASAWSYPLRDASPFKQLDWLFQNTARVLKSWSDSLSAMCECNWRSPKKSLTNLKWSGIVAILPLLRRRLESCLRARPLG